MIIYKIINSDNDKVYIGQTSEKLEDRFKRHIGYQAKSYTTKIHRAIRKYGKDKFSITEIDRAITQEELDMKEKYWIEHYNSVEDGYNISEGGLSCGGDTLSNHPDLDVIKKKISEAVKGGNNPNVSRVKAINIITKEEFEYNSMKECQSEMQIDRHDHISRRCRNIIKKPYKNEWLFEYIE